MHRTAIAVRRNPAVASATASLWLACCAALSAQNVPAPPAPNLPVAIVPIDSSNPHQAAEVTGALSVAGGKAIITTSGSITSGSRTTSVILPRRGTLRVCASTTVKLAADTSVPAGALPGLLMAIDHGALEMSFATTPAAANADILVTPDFRILIGGPGASEVKVRLGGGGDTCVDNSGRDAPYVVVTSLFDSGLYRVQPGQRVMFQHGSLREVVDNEKESCGCPPPPEQNTGNEFPLAQSEGLAPTPPVVASDQNSAAPQAPQVPQAVVQGPPMVYSPAQAPAAVAPPSAPAAAATPTPAAPVVSAKPVAKKKPGPFRRFGLLLRRIFGAD